MTGMGIPPLLMQDMRHFLPCKEISDRPEEDDLRVLICESFQKSMYVSPTLCDSGARPIRSRRVTHTSSLPFTYLGWMDRLFILVYQPFSRENPKLCLDSRNL